ncbi:GerAB/ArcD/ProY family transporter [Paenibacillus sp. A14]|uniref:GerAB/ArcD/ProY family transporter n=1 Tax=Paenibacillus sp. A14 TaxID=3119820 RepID=UPI002FE0D26E
MPEYKISLRQLMIVTAMFTIGSGILLVPSGVASIAKQDAWIAALIGVLFGFITLSVHVLLARMYPEKNLMQICEALLGKWIGKFVGLLFLITFFLAGPTTVLQEVGTFVTIQMMPETPIEAIIILFGVTVALGARLGLEVLTRSTELMFPWVLFLFTAMTLLLLSEVKLEKTLPVLEFGVAPLFSAALSFASVVFFPHIILLMIYPASANHPKQAHKAVYIGTLIGSIVLVIVVALTILVLGPNITAKSMYPSYLLAQKINIGNFLQRIEAVMAIMWFISLFFRISLYLYMIVAGLSQIFGIKNSQALVLPAGWTMITMAVFIYPNVAYRQSWDAKVWIPYTLVIGVLLPLLLLGLHGIRKLWSRKSA